MILKTPQKLNRNKYWNLLLKICIGHISLFIYNRNKLSQSFIIHNCIFKKEMGYCGHDFVALICNKNKIFLCYFS